MIATIDQLRDRAMTYALVLLWLHVPLVGSIAYLVESGGWVEMSLVAAMAAGVTFERARLGSTLAVQMSAAAALAIAVSTIVYAMRGHPWQADAHMLFFAAFALTAVFCDWRPIVVYAIVIAVHHLLLNFIFTAAIFPGEASLGRVMLHATVLVVQAVPLIWLAFVLAGLFNASDTLLQQATSAQQEAIRYADDQSQQRESLGQIVADLGSGLQDLSVGNLTRPLSVPFDPAYEPLRMDFNKALEKLSETISQVVDVSLSIQARATEISTASEDLSRRTENQAAALEETAAALDQMTASVRSAAEGAQDVENIVNKSRAEAESSKSVVEGAVIAMSEIERSSQQISQIIGSIDDIAFQTNLLALNAGVEAARAGDAGRGFAVVASEVRALAQRSSAAAKEIKTLIVASARHVGRGVDQVGKAGEALHNTISSVTEISKLVANISNGAAEQSTGLGEINAGVVQLDQVTQKNAAMVEESTAASQSLHQDALALGKIVSTFHVSKSPADQGRPTAPAPLDQRKQHTNNAPAPHLALVVGKMSRSVWQEF